MLDSGEPPRTYRTGAERRLQRALSDLGRPGRALPMYAGRSLARDGTRRNRAPWPTGVGRGARPRQTVDSSRNFVRVATSRTTFPSLSTLCPSRKASAILRFCMSTS